MDIKIKRGQILKELRVQKGLKQSELAKFLGITQQAYQRYEYGTSEPNADGFAFLADFYGVTTDYLLGRELPAEKLDPISQLSLEEMEEDIIRRWLELKPTARQIFLKFMRDVVHDYEERKDSGDYIVSETTVGAEMDRMEEGIADAEAEKDAG